MESKKQLAPEETSELYFEFQADMGITKHMGGLKATQELIELCHIREGKYVLDVGCGIGRTPCYIAKRHGCRVVGADISPGMVDRSRERAKRAGLEDRVEFRIADAQNLPFDNALFDAVIAESVTAFVEDKQKATGEYLRVTKPGGYVGINEGTRIEALSPELVEYLSRVFGAEVEFLGADGWKELLEGSGLRDIESRTCRVNALEQWISEVRWLDPRDFWGAWHRFLSGCITSSAYRQFAKEALGAPRSLLRLFKYIGYGMYVGRR